MWAAGIIFVGGGAYFDLRRRVASIEKAVGNGVPGVFLRRAEAALIQDDCERRANEVDARVQKLESRDG